MSARGEIRRAAARDVCAQSSGLAPIASNSTASSPNSQNRSEKPGASLLPGSKKMQGSPKHTLEWMSAYGIALNLHAQLEIRLTRFWTPFAADLMPHRLAPRRAGSKWIKHFVLSIGSARHVQPHLDVSISQSSYQIFSSKGPPCAGEQVQGPGMLSVVQFERRVVYAFIRDSDCAADSKLRHR